MPTLYRDTGYSLMHLIEDIQHGNIALPDIQRPFVWSPSKVRDLLDSMYRGFPIGTLMFWETGAEVTTRQIGTASRDRVARLLVVDGQQRLTSLFSVITGQHIVTKTFEEKRIRIAFRATDETFQVTDAAIERDPDFISDITVLWRDRYKSVINNFFARLSESRTEELTSEEQDLLEGRIDRVRDLRDFRFQVIELQQRAEEDEVADIFVRVNSEGVQLNQADFILTLMSVHWEKGRRELEQFCREAVNQSSTRPSPKNPFLDPAPEQLLRAGVGLAFRRGRLQDVYKILRGKDLNTGEVSPQRDEQFALLQSAQDEVLDLTNWHEFLKCLIAAGFRGRRMVTSANAVIYTYLLWLIGRRDFRLRTTELQGVISRWFFMAHTTGRYTSSPESQIESDLRRISEIDPTDGQAFCEALDRIIRTKFTQDFWDISLPSLLDTSASKSPALSAYWAALILLDANLLFSNLKIRDLFDPAVTAPRSIERHHLFPKKYLSNLGISGTRQNAIANMAFVDWSTNAEISMKDPADYWAKMSNQLRTDKLQQHMYWHALPNGWWQMDYSDFIEARRGRIADVVREGFKQLWDEESGSVEPELSISDLIDSGETQSLEFKSTGRWNLRTSSKDSKMEHIIVKTVCGFLNAEGGTLLIGIGDDGEVIGLDKDYQTLTGKPNKDGYELWLRQHLDKSLSCQTAAIVRIEFATVNGNDICVVHVGASRRPVFAKSFSGGDPPSEFWVRVGNATKQMHGDDMVDYQTLRWESVESWRPLDVEARQYPKNRQPDDRVRSDDITEPIEEETELTGLEEDRALGHEWRKLRLLKYLKHFYEAPGGRLHHAEAKSLAIQEGYDPRGTAGFYQGTTARLRRDGDYRVLTDAGRQMYLEQRHLLDWPSGP